MRGADALPRFTIASSTSNRYRPSKSLLLGAKQSIMPSTQDCPSIATMKYFMPSPRDDPVAPVQTTASEAFLWQRHVSQHGLFLGARAGQIMSLWCSECGTIVNEAGKIFCLWNCHRRAHLVPLLCLSNEASTVRFPQSMSCRPYFSLCSFISRHHWPRHIFTGPVASPCVSRY